MSLQPGIAPRRLAQNSGGFINTTLANRLRLRRNGQDGDVVKKTGTDVETQRTNACYNNITNDELFDAREGEVMVASHELTGFPNNRRAAVFSSLNGWRSSTRDPHEALHDSDFQFIGLCQNGFVSSNIALQEQGMTCQTSGIKTIVNDSNETINIGDRLMVDTMNVVPQRKGIPNEKVTLVLRKVPQNYLRDRIFDRVVDRGATLLQQLNARGDSSDSTIVKQLVALTILEMRKAGKWVVGVAMSAARKGEQLDVLLTRPSFI